MLVSSPNAHMVANKVPCCNWNIHWLSLVQNNARQLPIVLESEILDLPVKRDSFKSDFSAGVSACMLALGAYVCGNDQVAVYDGSWTEWYQKASPEEKQNVPEWQAVVQTMGLCQRLKWNGYRTRQVVFRYT